MVRMIARALCAQFLTLACALSETVFDYHSVRKDVEPLAGNGVFEGEHMPFEGKGRTQGMSQYGPDWSGDAHFLWEGKVGDRGSVTFEIFAKGTYSAALRLTKAIDYGVFEFQLPGGKPVAFDSFSTNVERAEEISLGAVELEPGEHQLEFTLTGRNANAKTFRKNLSLLGLDYLKLTNLTPPEKKEKKPVVEPLSQIPIPSHEDVRAAMKQNCFGCHNPDKKKGKIDLQSLATKEDFLADTELVEKIIDAVDSREMPPEDEEQQPDDATRTKITALFGSYVDAYLQTSGTLEPVVMRRLNRYEYSNAVRDLLALKGDIYPLPEKTIRSPQPYYDPASGRMPRRVRAGNRSLGKFQIERPFLTGVVPYGIDLQAEHGFNNRGDELSVSPLLLESFVKLSRSIVDAPEFDGYCTKFAETFTTSETSAEANAALARERLEPLLERAFRQRITADVAERYGKFFDREFASTGSFADSMKSVIAAVLASPRFLYVVEEKRDATGREPIGDYELATRLSFFLWSSLPDEELLDLARRGELRKPETLAAQVKRMIDHPLSKALAENFARQWLRLDQLITAVPDMGKFPEYYSRIGCEQWKFGLQTMIEPLLLFESIIVEDRSIMLLIDSNYAFRSDELQSWYADPTKPFGGKANQGRFNTNQQEFKRRALKTRREGGVLTSAATLTMTSAPMRTSPIVRGAWVATVIFNDPPPPAAGRRPGDRSR